MPHPKIKGRWIAPVASNGLPFLVEN